MRVLTILGLTVVMCGVYGWFFGLQTGLALETRYMARKMPVVNKVPIELPDLSVSQAPGKKLTYFGYEFEIPWDDIDESRSRTIGADKVIIAFRSGNVLSVLSGSPRAFVNSVLSSKNVDPNTLRQLYGAEVFRSDYAFHHLMLEATPARITPLASKKAAVSQAMLIVMKGICAPRGAESGIFAVKAAEFSGFQYGYPPNTSGLSVELFSDGGSLDFVFGQKLNGPTVILQPDVNRILRTLHKTSLDAVAEVNFRK